MENLVEIRKGLPKGKRQPKGSNTKELSVTLPEFTIDMLKRLSYQNGKTLSALTNAMIWWGYHAQIAGDFKPEEGVKHDS